MHHQLFPAIEAGHALECDTANPDTYYTSPFEDLSLFPFDLLFSQNMENLEPTTICPTDTYINPSQYTYGFQEATFAEKSKNDLLLSYLFGIEQQPSQLDIPLEEPSQNDLSIDFDYSNFGDISGLSSPISPSISLESFFLNSPFSSPSSSTLSYPDSPSFSPETGLDSLFPHPLVDLVAPPIYT
jgi:hypothetical protein